MGISFSYPFEDMDDFEDAEEDFEALFMRSLSFKDNDVNTRSVSFNGRDSERTILKSFGSGKMFIDGSLGFKRRELDPFHLETRISVQSPSSKESEARSASFEGRETSDPSPSPASNHPIENTPSKPPLEPSGRRHEAALRLQKVYKSFQTRRRLADCAVLVEQHWWKLLDFAVLKRSSVSFFDIEKQETAVSRWSRARTRAAMVGRGLSKDKKARKLALQHWLEAIDPRHRYGHNLHMYYVSWLQCESKQPFFYWLDVGEGRDVSLEQCPRAKLQHQCIKYLGPKEREAYEVIVEDGKFRYKHNGQLVDTPGDPGDSKWIFVLSTLKKLYVGQKNKGTFQHSSFLAGGATSAAGRLIVENGILKAVWPHSGHYRPTKENFQQFVNFLKEKYVDLTNVQANPVEEEEEKHHGSHADHARESSQVDLDKLTVDVSTDNTNTEQGLEQKQSRAQRRRPSKLAIPNSTFTFERPNSEVEGRVMGEVSLESQSVGKRRKHGMSLPEQGFMFQKMNLFDYQEEDEEECVPTEKILNRITSRKGTNSYQLGQQLSFKWTTGVGPRIGCVRDYPSELQFRALEEVNLSPRQTGGSRLHSSPRTYLSPKPLAMCRSPKPWGGAFHSPKPWPACHSPKPWPASLSPKPLTSCLSPKPPAMPFSNESKENGHISGSNNDEHNSQC